MHYVERNHVGSVTWNEMRSNFLTKPLDPEKLNDALEDAIITTVLDERSKYIQLTLEYWKTADVSLVPAVFPPNVYHYG